MPEEVPNVLTDGPRGGIRTRLVDFERALRNDWPISKDVRDAAIAALKDIVANAKSQRTKIRAVSVLIQADALNARRESNDQPPPIPPEHAKSDEATEARQKVIEYALAKIIEERQKPKVVIDQSANGHTNGHV
jgi:hypothetical protein